MFSDVENNAQQQDRLFQDTRSPLIEDYYPELHQENATPFSCSISSNLIPDLITRRRILIDLGELPTEADLINRFGVNKAFLMELRKRKLVHIATNLDPGRHERNVWMHDILADKETIFKSTRTPRFFRARFPDTRTAPSSSGTSEWSSATADSATSRLLNMSWTSAAARSRSG